MEFFFLSKANAPSVKGKQKNLRKMYRGKIANGEIVADDDEVQVLTMALLNLFTRC